MLRAILLHACSATLLEVGALDAPGAQPSWQALHLRPQASQQARQACRQLQELVLRELPKAMLHMNSEARSHAAE